MDDATFRRARIVAADDEESCLRLMRRVLERAGLEGFTGTTDPRRVVALVRELRPDLVMLDLNMPGMDGLEVLEALHPLPAGECGVPVLMVSGGLTPEARERALAHGARDFLPKPYDPAEAVRRVRALLETRFRCRDDEGTDGEGSGDEGTGDEAAGYRLQGTAGTTA